MSKTGRKPVITYDTETTGFNPYLGCDMFSFSTCTEDDKVGVHRLDGPKVRRVRNRKVLEKFWSTTRSIKSMHNAKFDLGFTEKELHCKLDNHTIHDTSIMSHILQNWHPHHRLKDLAWELGGFPREDEALVKRYATDGYNYQIVPEHVMTSYQKGDVQRGMLLQMFFLPKIMASEAYRDIYDMERELVWTTLRMEQRGIMVNRKRCQSIISNLEDELTSILVDLEAAAGWPVGPSKPNDVCKLLYKDMGLPVLKRTPKTQAPSTEKEVLLDLRKQVPDNPVLDLIIKFRSYSRGVKILAGYLDCSDADGIIHPSIHTNGARTSRESCSNPNLQNVEKTGVLLNPFPVPARQAFRPKPGYVNFHIDYSGIEMRLLVHYSGDQTMIKIFNDGENPHETAAEIFYGRRYTGARPKAKKSLYGAAKNAHFAIPYGAGANKVAETLGLTAQEGKTALREYERTFPKLCNLNKVLGGQVSDYGYVETAFGRRLHLPKDKPYIGTNYIVQGTAAGILKRAQNRVHEYLEDATSGEVGLILPIHDEIILEFPRKRLKDHKSVLRDVRELMVDFPQFEVPLDVDIGLSTRDWETQTPVELEE